MNLGQPDNQDHEEIMAEINMTPLIDIMLVLLIIFMVTSSISLESGLDVELPTASARTQEGGGDEATAVIVSLTRDGRIAVQGQFVPDDQLHSAISEALREERADLVIFEGDRQSQFGRAVEIMDLAKAAGASRFAIAADEAP